MTFCLVRRSDFSVDRFHAYWRDVHAPLVLRHAAALGIRRYRQLHTDRDPELAPMLAGRNGSVPYDGVAELWLDSKAYLLRNAQNVAARQAAKELREDEGRFIDMARSPLFFGAEHLIIAP